MGSKSKIIQQIRTRRAPPKEATQTQLESSLFGPCGSKINCDKGGLQPFRNSDMFCKNS